MRRIVPQRRRERRHSAGPVQGLGFPRRSSEAGAHRQQGTGRVRGVLLVPEVDRPRAGAATGLPAAGLRRRARARRGAGDPGEQPPVLRRLAVHAADARRAGSPSSPRPSTSPTPGIKGWFQKHVLLRCRAGPDRPVRRQRRRGRADCRPRRSSARASLFGIYPEGTRSHDGKLYRGKTGVARLALETGVPVIPVAVVGTDVVAPPGKKFGSFTRPVVRFGKPLDFSRYEGMENDRYILRSITDEIMYEIMRLSGQEYVDMYASRAKEEAKRPSEKQPPPRTPPSRGRDEHERRRPDADAGPGPGPTGVAVEDRLFRALAVLRVLVLVNTVGLNVYRRDNFAHPTSRCCSCLVVLVAWTASPSGRYADRRPAARRCCWSPTWRSGRAAAGLGQRGQGDRLQRHGARLLGDGRRCWPGPIHWRWARRAGRRRSCCRSADLAVARPPDPGQLRQRLPAADRRSDRRLHVRRRCSGWPRARRGRARAPPPPRSGPGWRGRCTTASCRCSRSSSAGVPSSAASRPSSDGWPASRRRRCAR